MTPKAHLRIVSWTLLVMLPLTAAPSLAQEPEATDSTLALGLEELRPIAGLDLRWQPTAPPGASLPREESAVTGDQETVGHDQETQRVELASIDSWSAWRNQLSAQQTAAAAAPRRGGFGRWLKKHWYVPTIAGVLLGAVLLDDDDDLPGEED